MPNIHHDLAAITDVALHYAKEHGCNYNVILKNPDEFGKFSFSNGSTYEFVTDSYFNKERSNVIILSKTDDLLQAEQPKEEVVEAVEVFRPNIRHYLPEKMVLPFNATSIGSKSNFTNYAHGSPRHFGMNKRRKR